MKLEIDREQLEERKVKDKIIAFRIPETEYNALKSYHPNLSKTVRNLVTQFITELVKEKGKWTRKSK